MKSSIVLKHRVCVQGLMYVLKHINLLKNETERKEKGKWNLQKSHVYVYNNWIIQ